MSVWPESGSVLTAKVGSLFCHLAQRDRQLVHIVLRLGLNGHIDDRFRELNVFQHDG